jgi:pyrimidine-nucleoside phosphorylase
MIDVKNGSGAFMKTLELSIRLAEEMVSIVDRMGIRPKPSLLIGHAPCRCIGNSLEFREAIESLRKGRGPENGCFEQAARKLGLAEKAISMKAVSCTKKNTTKSH